MKKGLFSIFMFLIFTVSFFAGCNLFEQDVNAYLNQVVAKNGKIEITIEEVANYSSNISSLIEQGYTAEAAVRYLIDLLIEKEYLLEHIETLIQKEKASNTSQANYKYSLTNNEINEVIHSVWSTITTNLSSIRKGIDPDNVFGEKEEETTGTVKKVFEPAVTLVKDGTEYLVRRITEEDKEQETLLNKYDYVAPAYEENLDKKVWNKFIASLINSEKGRGLSTVPSEAFKRYINKLYKNAYENKLLSKFQSSYENNYGYDSNGYLTPSTTKEILDYFINGYNTNVEMYQNINSKQYYTDMISNTNRASVFYNYDINEFYEVSHILIKTDDLDTEIATIEADPFLDDNEKATKIADLKKIENVMTYARENGVETKTQVSVEDIVKEIKDIEDEYDVLYTKGTQNYAQKISEAFDKLIYKYNEDDGIMNADFDYVVGKNHSAMIDEFTEASRELFEKGEGSISDPVLGKYGYHIIIYNRKVKNLVNDSNDITLKILDENYTSRTSGKTYLEYVLEKVKTTNYSNYETLLLSELMNQNGTVYYKKVLNKFL